MVAHGAVDDTDEQREIYRYGLELQVYYIIHGVVFMGIGFFIGQAVEVALLLLLFGTLQANGGGYHANTHAKCFITMACILLVFLILLPIYQSILPLQLVSVLFGLGVVVALAPVAHKNHPLNPQMSKKMGKKAKLIAILFALVWGLIFYLGVVPFMLGIISIIMALAGVSMIAAWVKSHRTPTSLQSK
jgi:accessory gene regulator B